MKKYSDASAVTWDAWFVNRDNATHAFYLQNGPLTRQDDPRAGWAIGHAVTENGMDWTALPSVLPPRLDPDDPQDFHSKFTGCAVNHDDGGVGGLRKRVGALWGAGGVVWWGGGGGALATGRRLPILVANAPSARS